MNCTEIQELAAAYALGALDPAGASRMQAMADADPDVRSELDLFLRVAERLLAGVKPVAPPVSARANVLARIARTPQLREASRVPAAGDPSPEGFRFLRPASGPWTEGPFPGARFQMLSADWRRNRVMVYLELAPGTRYPDHTHGGAEDLFLVTGDLLTAGRLMKAGDFVHCEAGTEHQEVISPSGCQALLVTTMGSVIGDFARGKVKAAGSQLAKSLGFLE